MESTNPKYSIIIPVFNSQDSLSELFTGIKNTFIEINETFEIIFVDDNSKDNSWNILQTIKTENPNNSITLIKLIENFGQHKATLCGIDFSKGEYIITIDDDLQTPPEEIKKLIGKQKGNPEIDLIYGFYTHKAHSKLRNIGSKIINTKKLFREAKKNGSSFRIFKSKLAEKLELAQYRNFVYIDELLLWSTGKVDFVDVVHQKRIYNKSGYSFPRLFSIGSHLMLFGSSTPIKLMIYIGFLFSLLSFFAGIIFIYRKLIHNVPMGYTSLIVAIFFSTSILLFSLGIIASYIHDIYIQINKKPTYLTKTIIK